MRIVRDCLTDRTDYPDVKELSPIVNKGGLGRLAAQTSENKSYTDSGESLERPVKTCAYHCSSRGCTGLFCAHTCCGVDGTAPE